MTDFVKLILKQKIGGLTNNENFGSSSFFKGGPVGICFASWKKSDWFLPPQHIKKWEKVWFFSKPEKNVLQDHFGKEVKHDIKNLDFQKKPQWTQNLHVTENWVSRPWNGSWKKQNVFWKAELISDMTDKVVFRKSKFKAT